MRVSEVVTQLREQRIQCHARAPPQLGHRPPVGASTGVGFVFAIVPEGVEAHAISGLINFVHAHMYEQRLSRCGGASFVYERASRFSSWVLVNQKWKHDAAKDAALRARPLPKVAEHVVPRYRFGVGDGPSSTDET